MGAAAIANPAANTKKSTNRSIFLMLSQSISRVLYNRAERGILNYDLRISIQFLILEFLNVSKLITVNY